MTETDYVVKTPDRKRQTWLCHLNMLKPFHTRDNLTSTESTDNPTVPLSTTDGVNWWPPQK